MARINLPKQNNGKRILIVDDQTDFIAATTSLLEREGYEVESAISGNKALVLLKENHYDLLLLDYFMPGMTGEELVVKLREFDPFIQIILQTGYAGEIPPRKMLKSLDIQGYHDKTDGPDKLLLWVEAGLKSAYMVQLLYKSRQGLRYILDITPDLHKIQPVEELLQGILLQISGLLGVVDSFVAVIRDDKLDYLKNLESDGFIALIEDNANIVIPVATGKYLNMRQIDPGLELQKIKSIQEVLKSRKIKIDENYTILPLIVGDFTLGIIYVDKKINNKEDYELLYIFSNQAAVAIHNARLYEMATIDQLTGIYVRRFFEQCLLRELRTSFRLRQPISLIMLDMDDFKKINDTAGHMTGDQALTIMGNVLKKATSII